MELIRKIAENAKKGPSKANNSTKANERKGNTPPKNKSNIAQKEKAPDKKKFLRTMTGKTNKSKAKSIDLTAKNKKNDEKKKEDEKAKKEKDFKYNLKNILITLCIKFYIILT